MSEGPLEIGHYYFIRGILIGNKLNLWAEIEVCMFQYSGDNPFFNNGESEI